MVAKRGGPEKFKGALTELPTSGYSRRIQYSSFQTSEFEIRRIGLWPGGVQGLHVLFLLAGAKVKIQRIHFQRYVRGRNWYRENDADGISIQYGFGLRPLQL